MEFELDEFLEEIKVEMSGYEEITEELINNWETRTKAWILENVNKKNRIIKNNNSIYIQLDDESDIFKVVDRYLAAVDGDEVEAYWQGFSLL
jgi:hypothetical protein